MCWKLEMKIKRKYVYKVPNKVPLPPVLVEGRARKKDVGLILKFEVGVVEETCSETGM